MGFCLQLPPPDLAEVVRYFWEYKVETDCRNVFQPIVDGCPGIIFQQPGYATLHDPEKGAMPDLFLYGQSSRAPFLVAQGPLYLSGASFFPEALRAIFGMEAHELTDDCVGLDLVDARSRELLDTMQNSEADQQLPPLFNYFRAAATQMDAREDGRVTFALQRIQRVRGHIHLPDLQRETGLSERSLERHFKRTVGLSPKLFARICRFQFALRQMKAQRFTRLSDVAFDNRYADQSHFIREFKQFTGLTPRRFAGLENDFRGEMPGLLAD